MNLYYRLHNWVSGPWKHRSDPALPENRAQALSGQEAEMLRYQLRHDATTGLPNRLFLGEHLRQAIQLASRGTGFALLLVDLDRFKPVNAIYGKAAGDLLLGQTAQRMLQLIGPADVTARIGGDKFAILHFITGVPCSAMALAQSVIRSLQEPFVINGYSVAVGASIGVTDYSADDATAEILLQNAETALQHARVQGGGQPCRFEAEMRGHQELRRQMQHDFRQAIALRQFTVHYQPLFESADLALSGFEALARWDHPVHGMISPAKFIPFAEKSGLMTSLGQFVLETACAEAAGWPEHLRVSVNISPVEFGAGDLVERVQATLQLTGLAPRRLELEITEGALIENPEQARQILGGLKAMGVQITIDDFGTGYSSLSYLRHFRFDRIKIDRSFIEHLEQEPDALVIVRAIIDLGHALRVDVLAEGVETGAQLQLLRDQSCDQIQGFLLGRPAAAAAAKALVEARSIDQSADQSTDQAGAALLPFAARKLPPNLLKTASSARSG